MRERLRAQMTSGCERYLFNTPTRAELGSLPSARKARLDGDDMVLLCAPGGGHKPLFLALFLQFSPVSLRGGALATGDKTQPIVFDWFAPARQLLQLF